MQQLPTFIKGVSFSNFEKRSFIVSKIGFCNGKAPSDMDGREVERKIKGVLFFKNSLHYIVIS